MVEKATRGRLNRKQGVLIASYRLMGERLNQEFALDPELTTKLSKLVHNPELAYRDVVIQHLTGSDASLISVSSDPFLKAFELTLQCSDEDKAILTRLRIHAGSRDLPESLAPDFHDWVHRRANFIGKGLQRAVLDGDGSLIPRLTPEEAALKSSKAAVRWGASNPVEAARIRMAAAQAAAEAAEPRTYTKDVKTVMQEWFDQGYEYGLVVELLKGLGIATTVSNLRSVVRRDADLTYTPARLKQEQEEGFSKAARRIFELSGSKEVTKNILHDLGYSPRKVERALLKQGLRERIRWGEVVNISGKKEPLSDIVLKFIAGNYPNVKAEWQAFLTHLEANQVELVISFESYSGRRRYLLGNK